MGESVKNKRPPLINLLALAQKTWISLKKLAMLTIDRKNKVLKNKIHKKMTISYKIQTSS